MSPGQQEHTGHSVLVGLSGTTTGRPFWLFGSAMPCTHLQPRAKQHVRRGAQRNRPSQRSIWRIHNANYTERNEWNLVGSHAIAHLAFINALNVVSAVFFIHNLEMAWNYLNLCSCSKIGRPLIVASGPIMSGAVDGDCGHTKWCTL